MKCTYKDYEMHLCFLVYLVHVWHKIFELPQFLAYSSSPLLQEKRKA